MSEIETSHLSRIQDGWYQTPQLATSLCSGELSYHAALVEIPPTETHCDFISVLAVAQRWDIEFLPITWQPALDKLGKGGTAEISQSLINLQLGFAFKRTTLSKSSPQDSQAERHTFQVLVSEVSILSYPPIRNHPNIINLEGICWEIAPEEERVFPVLVFEKSQLGDLWRFMDSDEGEKLCIAGRLKLCADIATAIMVMHSSHVIHGDIKPENVLIFRDDSGSVIAKLTDFGYSTLAANEDGLVSLPKSWPWHAPEYHGRKFTFSAAKKTDTYSFGMLCLWLICKEKLQEATVDTFGTRDHFTSPVPREGNSTLKFLGKAKDKMVIFACSLIRAMAALDNTQKSNLEQFFNSTLASSPENRNSDFKKLIRFLGQESMSLPPVSDVDEGIPSLSHTDFQVSRDLYHLCIADYRVRRQIAKCLKAQAESSSCASCSSNAAFQMAFCSKIGFGIERNENQALRWLERSKMKGLVEQIETTRSLIRTYGNNRIELLSSDGSLPLMDHANEYRKTQGLEKAESEYIREINDMRESLGSGHKVVLSLKLILASIFSSKGDFGRVEELFVEDIKELEDNPNSEPTRALAVYKILAIALKDQGKYKEAEELFRRELEGIEEVHGKEHQTTLKSVANLAIALKLQGKYDAAEKMHRRVLEGQQKVIGEKHPDTLTSMGHLATTLHFQGKYEAAEEIYRQEIEGREKAQGGEHPATLSTISNLVGTLQAQGKYNAAEEMLRRVLGGQQKVLGEKHPDTLISISNLAQVLEYQGKYEAAEQMHRRALEGREKALGKEHPHTLNSVCDLGSVLRYQGKYEAAEEMLRHSLEGFENTLGKEHLYTLSSVTSLGLVLQDQNKNEAAEKMHQRMLEWSEKALGKEHPDTLRGVHYLGSVFRRQGKYKAAEEMYRQALEGKEKALGKEHPDTLSTVCKLGLALQDQGKYEAAEEMHRRALDGREKAFGKEHPATLSSVDNLGAVFQNQGKYEMAEEMLRRVLEGSQNTLGKEHPFTLSSVDNLGAVLQDQSKYEAAEEIYRQALEWRKEALGKEHPDTLRSVYNLGSVFQNRGKYKEANEMYKLVLEGFEKALEEDRSDKLTAINNLRLRLEA